MGLYALLDDGKQVVAFRSIFDDEAIQGCEEEALRLGLAAETKKGLALGPGVEIACLEE